MNKFKSCVFIFLIISIVSCREYRTHDGLFFLSPEELYQEADKWIGTVVAVEGYLEASGDEFIIYQDKESSVSPNFAREIVFAVPPENTIFFSEKFDHQYSKCIGEKVIMEGLVDYLEYRGFIGIALIEKISLLPSNEKSEGYICYEISR